MKAVLVLISFLSFYVFAGDEPGKKPVVQPADTHVEKRNITESIFDEIMQSIPEDIQKQLDSIKTAKSSPVKQRQDILVKHPEKTEINLKKRDDIPDELREKIEKAMKDLEKNQARRQIEFKDSKRR